MDYKKEIASIVKDYKETDDCHLYCKSCYESALKAYQTLEDDGHSGMSWGITRSILIRMLYDLPLKPITEDDKFTTWSFDDKTEICERYSGLSRTKNENGEWMYSDIHRYSTSNGFSNGLGHKILNEMFPITLPYFPSVKKYHIEVEDFSTTGEIGCFDTVAIYSIKTPEGELVQVNRFFKEGQEQGNGVCGVRWIEIDEEEYNQRKKQYETAINNK